MPPEDGIPLPAFYIREYGYPEIAKQNTIMVRRGALPEYCFRRTRGEEV